MIDLTKIGMSDLAPVAGLSRWQGPIDIYRRVALGEITEATRIMERGHRFEGPVLKEWEIETGGKLLGHKPVDLPAYPFLRANVDSIGELKGETLVVEAKTANFRMAQHWEDGEIPQEYLCQAQGYLWATGLGRCDVVALLGGCEVRISTVLPDTELQEMLIDAAARFWRNHIEKKVPPMPDGSESYSDFVKTRFPTQSKPLLIATPVVDALLSEYRAACEQSDASAERAEALKNQLKVLIGDGEGISSRLGSILWRNNKPVTRTDWEALAMALKPTPEQLQQFTITKPGPRVFRATWKKSTKEAA